MKEEIFRKKSLEKVKSPENLDDYIQVSNPGVWLLLVSIIILLAGVIVWGVFGHIDSTIQAGIQVKNGTAICYIEDEAAASVKEGMTVRTDDYEAVISEMNKSDEGYTCELKSDQTIQDGFYECEIVTRSYRPLSFVLN